MLKTHTTAQGTTMLIAEMDDDHLKNTIFLFTRKLRQLKAIAANGNGNNELENRLYDRPNMIDAEEAIYLWQETIKLLYPYLAEALVRKAIFEKIHEELVDVLGRHMPIEKAPRLFDKPQLPDVIEHEDWPNADIGDLHF